MYEGEFLIQSVFKLFKNRPSCAVSIVLVAGMIILGVMLVQAKTPDDRVFPVAGLVVIVLVGLMQIVQAVRRHTRSPEFAVSADKAQPADPSQAFPVTESVMQPAPPVPQPLQVQAAVEENAPAVVPGPQLNLLGDGFRYVIDGPARIRQRTIDIGPVRGSLEAIVYSFVLQGLVYVIMLMIGGCLLVLPLARFPAVSPQVNPLENIFLAIPLVFVGILIAALVIPMFLSAFAAAALALSAFLIPAENKLKALAALLISSLLLVIYFFGTLLTIGLSFE